MSIQDTYTEYLTESVIKEILTEGTAPTIAEITARLEALEEGEDLTTPRFDADTYTVDKLENSSATKVNAGNTLVQQDITALYRYLFDLSNQVTNNFDRWRAEANLLDGRLDDLSDRICSLLLLEEDTSGYFNYMQDSFTDLSKIDQAHTTVKIDLPRHRVAIGASNSGATRRNLNHIDTSDIEFTVLSRENLKSSVAAPGSSLKHVVTDVNTFWQQRIYTNKPGPVSIELKIKLSETAVPVSRIDVDLHASNSNSTITVTPLLSTDNYNYTQLPITDFSRGIIDKTTFRFSSQNAKWIKFILTKPGYDLVHRGVYSYEFGVDEIAFYNEGYSSSTSGFELVSQPLSVTDEDGQIEQFSEIALEAEEEVPEGTSIDYYAAASNTAAFPVVSGMWVSLDPIGREGATKPQTLSFGDLDTVSITGVGVSYDPDETTTKYINPDREFTSIASISNAVATTADIVSSEQRYSFQNPTDFILDYEVDTSIDIAKNTLEIWRNVSTQGSNTLVRGYSNGWGFSEPYYITTGYVSSETGVDIDFGDQIVVVDGAAVNGVIHFEKGPHIIWVHKDNWEQIVYTATDLATLKTDDTKYPYNHRYLIEGWPYPTDWSTDEEKIYRGFDIVAEYKMKEVAPMDIIDSVASDDYSKFALDLDSEDAGATIDGTATTKSSMTCFLLKADGSNPDFLNENFTIVFKSANTLYKYLRFKAVLKTTDTALTPLLDFYRLKIAS